MQITLLSPTVQGLGQLSSFWFRDAKRFGYMPGSAPPEADRLRGTTGPDTPSEDLGTKEPDVQVVAEATK